MSDEAIDAGTRDRIRRAIAGSPSISDAGILGKFLLDPAHKETVQEIRLDIAEDRGPSDVTEAETDLRHPNPRGEPPNPPIQDPCGNDDENEGEGGSEDRPIADENGPVSDPTTPAEHYSRDGIRAIYDELGACGGVGMAGGVADFSRWYRYERITGDSEATARGRIMTLSKDWSGLVGALDRTLYCSTTHVPSDWLADSWTPTKGTGADRVWRDEDGHWGDRAKPTPDYCDIGAQTLLVDIDLPDDLKAERHRGGEFPQETIEAALSYTVARFASLAGSRDRVFVLDSAGGIYVLVAPAVVAPLIDEFPDDSGALIDELTDRMNEWLEEVEADLKAEYPALEREGKDDVLAFDDVNHKNRIYKAPMSIHSTYDAVAHPLDPSSIRYEALALADVEAADIGRSRDWAAAFTADTEDHRAGCQSIVATLWDDVEGAGNWSDVISRWLDDQEQVDAHRNDAPTLPRPSPERDPDTVTAYVEDVQNAVDALDAERVGRDTIVASWKESGTDRSGSGLRSFYPTWDPGCNGNANVMNLAEGIWLDTGEGDKGGPAKMALIAAENYPRRGGYATGRDWWRGVRLLRERHGFDLPVYVPPVGSTHSHGERDRSPLWALCDAAVALGLCRREDLIERDGEDGTYQDLPTPVYNATLDALHEAEIDHGRLRRGDGEASRSTRAALVDEDEDDDLDEVDQWARNALVDLLG